MGGVLTYNNIRKNATSTNGYHIVSNLTDEQERDQIGYDGKTKEALIKKSSKEMDVDQMSERMRYRKSLQEVRRQERPNPMRSEVQDNYFNKLITDTSQDAMDVFMDIYKNAVDNRIFNNLKMQLNEMIEDEKSLISTEEFQKMFYTYFKGESKD